MFEEIDIKSFLTPEAKEKYASGQEVVFRHRKLDLADIIKFLMQPRTETMQVESQVFLELIHRNVNVTKEDIIERRSLISPEALQNFQSLNFRQPPAGYGLPSVCSFWEFRSRMGSVQSRATSVW